MKKELERITGVALFNTDGEMFALPKPARHANLFALAALLNQHAMPGEKQGFVTSHGRFVDRTVGRVIARKAGQIKEGALENLLLYSEDMW